MDANLDSAERYFPLVYSSLIGDVQELASSLGTGSWPNRREIVTPWVANTVGELDPRRIFLVENPNSRLGRGARIFTRRGFYHGCVESNSGPLLRRD